MTISTDHCREGTPQAGSVARQEGSSDAVSTVRPMSTTVKRAEALPSGAADEASSRTDAGAEVRGADQRNPGTAARSTWITVPTVAFRLLPLSEAPSRSTPALAVAEGGGVVFRGVALADGRGVAVCAAGEAEPPHPAISRAATQHGTTDPMRTPPILPPAAPDGLS